MNRAQALAQMRDIHGLDIAGTLAASLVGLLMVISVTLLMYLLWRYAARQRKNQWRIDARVGLQRLQREVHAGDVRQVLAEFSTLLRRIAMARKGRNACAGLCGVPWLQWLQQHDPKSFQWTCYGVYLTDIRYAPPQQDIAPDSVLPLLQAAKQWTYKE